MKRLAAPMVGGMLSSTLLTLIVIPASYSLWKEREVRQGRKGGLGHAAPAGTEGSPDATENNL
jgi:Cu(I)/Ag(I) efflux system membrane protein CusA/SilA